MSPCTFWSGLILATSSIALLHLGQPIASFCLVSDTTNLNSAHPKLKLVNAIKKPDSRTRGTINRQPSCLISCTQSGPVGGRSPGDGRQDSMKWEATAAINSH
jgi:hypothetical protein